MQGTAAEELFTGIESLSNRVNLDGGTFHRLFANQAVLKRAGAFEPYPAELSMKRRDDDFDDEEDWEEGDEDEWDDEEDLDEFDDEEDEEDWDDEDEDDEEYDEDWEEDLEDEDYENDEDEN